MARDTMAAAIVLAFSAIYGPVLGLDYLSSYADIVAYLSSGAPVQVVVDSSHCTANSTQNVQKPLSFTTKLDAAIYSRENGLVFNTETLIEGIDVGLPGLKLRVIELSMANTGKSEITISGLDPVTREVITSVSMTCPYGDGIKAVAAAPPAISATDFDTILQNLQFGSKYFVWIDVTACTADPRTKSLLGVDGDPVMVYVEVQDFEGVHDVLGHVVSFVVRKTFPVRNSQSQLDESFGQLTTNSDGTADLAYFVYTSGSSTPPTPQRWTCEMGSSVIFFHQVYPDI